MTILHLHIGMHKTGTTAFQHACEGAREELQRSGFTYHRDDLFMGDNHSYFRFLLEHRDPRELERAIRDAFAKNVSPNYIISGEDLSYLSVGNVALLASIFRDYFSQVRVYAVVRPPVAYMHSATQQILKDPRSNVETLFHRWDVTPSYERRFQSYIDIFGSVKFLAYRPDAPHDLADAMGVPICLNFWVDNKSVSRWTVKMLAAMKPFSSWDAVQSAADNLAAMDKSPANSHAPVELVEHWAGQVARDVAWLESVWDVPAGFFDEPPPSVPRSYYETFTLDEVRVLRMLAA